MLALDVDDTNLRPWGVLAVIVIGGILLRWPSLDAGFHMDDFAQLAMLDGYYPVPRASWDLFSFTKGAHENHTLIAHGALPWWSDPELRLGALRPLTSLAFALDVRVFGPNPVAMHVHSMAWWVATMVAAFVAVRRHVTTRVALVALALYALDDAHAYPVTWIANRSALISAALGFGGLWAHARWREDGWRPGRWLAVSALAGSLAAGEYGLCAVAFFVGYELRNRGTGIDRVRALAPVALVAVAYLVAHRAGGFGAQGSGVYIDPAADPLAFASALVDRLPVLLVDALLAAPLSLLLLHPLLSSHGPLLCAAALVPVFLILRRQRLRLDDTQRRRLDGWALGGMLALVPVSASFLSGRLTVIAALAGHVWLATWLVHVASGLRASSPRLRRWLGVVPALVVGTLHFVGAPLWGRAEIGSIAALNRAGMTASMRWPVDDATLPSRRVVVLTVSDPMMLIYPPSMRRLAGRPVPERWWVLSMAPHLHRMTRTGASALELTVRDGAMLRGRVQRLFRAPDRRPEVGASIDLEGLRIEILETEADGAPTRVRYTFDRSIDDPTLSFVIVSPQGLRAYPMPAVGASVTIAPGTHPFDFTAVDTGPS
jgi:hypothetical protein